MCKVVGGILSFSPSIQQIGIKVETLRYRGESGTKRSSRTLGEGKQSESQSVMSNSV